jgi:hypothetical protein
MRLVSHIPDEGAAEARLPRIYCSERMRRIFASVQRDYPSARRLGHMLITA